MEKKYSFTYTKTNSIIYSNCKDNNWEAAQSTPKDKLPINLLSGALQYGVQCFEGIKAFRGVDGKVRIFRPDENAKRMKRSADFLGMPCPPEELFVSMVKQAVEENLDFLPSYESGASMYIRPTLLNTAQEIGLRPTEEAMFFVMVMPVGAYTVGGLKPVKAVLSRQYDRAAPNGSGSYKLGGNYSPAFKVSRQASKEGYQAVLFPDSREKKYIDEFSSSNFFAIKGNTFITPKSPSVLPSITNKSLQDLAIDYEMNIEKRPILVTELATFDEAGECGTAVVITPVYQIDDKMEVSSPKDDPNTKIYTFTNSSAEQCGPKSQKLYNGLTDIQYGRAEDPRNWCIVL